MTFRRWPTLACAAALLATGACKSNGTGSGGSVNSRKDTANSGGAPAGADTSQKDAKMPSSPEGRRSDSLMRARGTDGTTPSGTTGTAGVANPSGGESGGLGSTTQTTSGESSGLNADKAPATGTTPGGQGVHPSNGTGTDEGSGSTKH